MRFSFKQATFSWLKSGAVRLRWFKWCLPLRIWLILFVPVMSDHAALPCLTTRPGDLHSSGGQSSGHMTGVKCQRSGVSGAQDRLRYLL